MAARCDMAGEHIQFGDCEIDVAAFTLRRGGKPCEVEPQVLELLLYLVRNPDRLLTREELIKHVWHGRFISDTTVTSRIKSARRAIGDDGAQQKLIRTVHGRGVRFLGTVTTTPSGAQQGRAAAAVAASADPAAPRPRPDRPSIAVLPFANRSDDPEQEYFADGITEDIIIALSNVSGLFVLGRNTVFTCKGKAVNLARLAEELGVAYLVEGSVRKAGQRVRISAQLIEGATGGHLWAASYDRDMTDVFALQDEITRTIVDQLKVKLLPAEKKAIEQPPTESIEAYTFYLKGREFFHRRSRAAYRTARQMFARAVELDPRYARAHASLAICDSKLFAKFGVASSVEGILATAEHAIALDPKLAEAHTARGLALNTQGRRDEALAALERALALDANCCEAYQFLGEFWFQDGAFERAADCFHRVMEIQPDDYRAPFALEMINQSLGRREEAERYARLGLERAEAEIRLHPESNLPLELGAAVLATMGERERAMAWIARALEIDPDDNTTRYNAACTYALLGEGERALDLLEAWVDQVSPDEKLWFRNDPDFEPLKAHPRYRKLLRQIGVPPAGGLPGDRADPAGDARPQKGR